MNGTAPRLLAWLALIALITYLVFFGGSWLGLYVPALRLFSVVLIAAGFLVWAGVAWRQPRWKPRSALFPAIVAALVSLAISTVFSRYPRVSLEYLGYAIVLAGLYLLLVRLLADPFLGPRLVALAGALFAVVSVIYVLSSVRRWVDWWAAVGRITTPPLRPEYESLTYGTPSTVLTIAAMLAIPALASLGPSIRGRLAGGLIVVALGLVAILTGSRAGWLGLGIALIATAVVMLGFPSTREAVAARLGRVGVRWILAIAGVALVALAIVGPAILRRVASGGEENRLTFVRVALELFAESPVVGGGPGSWVIERLPLTRADEIDEYIPHAHNLYAQTLGELGIVGALAGLFVVATLVLLLRDGIRSALQTRRRWAWLTLFGWAYFAAHQLLDFYPNMPAVLFAAALPVAYLDATSAPGTRLWHLPAAIRVPGIPSRIRRASMPAALAFMTVAIAGLGLQEIPALQHDTAVNRALAGDWAGADAPARVAAAEDPDISPYLFTAGLTASRAGDHLAAAGYFAQVAHRDDFPEAWLNLAAEQVTQNQSAEAEASIRAALRLGRQRPAVAMPAGDLALRIGKPELAIEAFAAAIAVTPSLAGDPWWTGDPARSKALAVALPMAAAAMPAGGRWEVYLMAGDVSEATQLATESGDPQHTRTIVNAWNGDAAALSQVVSACDADPLDVPSLRWCARLEAHAGYPDAASRFRYMVNVVSAGSYRAAAELRVNPSPPTVRPVFDGGPAIAWGTYTYRRATTWDVLVPGLLRLNLE